MVDFLPSSERQLRRAIFFPRCREPHSPMTRLALTPEEVVEAFAASKRLLTPHDVADRLRVCLKTAYNILNSGAVPVVTLGRALRVDESDLDRYIEERKKCRQSSPRKAATKSSLAKGDTEYMKFCQQGRRAPKPKNGKRSSDVKYLIRTT